MSAFRVLEYAPFSASDNTALIKGMARLVVPPGSFIVWLTREGIEDQNCDLLVFDGEFDFNYFCDTCMDWSYLGSRKALWRDKMWNIRNNLDPRDWDERFKEEWGLELTPPDPS